MRSLELIQPRTARLSYYAAVRYCPGPARGARARARPDYDPTPGRRARCALVGRRRRVPSPRRAVRGTAVQARSIMACLYCMDSDRWNNPSDREHYYTAGMYGRRGPREGTRTERAKRTQRRGAIKCGT